jgi:hypothetical protein
MLNDTFVFFLIAVVLIILVSIQFTLNKILQAVNEIKSSRRSDDYRK